MDWIIEWFDEGFVKISTTGIFNADDQGKMVLEVLEKEYWSPGTNSLFNHEKLDFGSATLETMISASKNHISLNDRIGNGKTAMVLVSDAAYGSARQFLSLTEDQILSKLKIFRDEEAAIEWVCQKKAKASCISP